MNSSEFTQSAKIDNANPKSRKDAKFTARLNQSDFDAFKELASDKGMLYQTLLGHTIHQYVEGKLVDVNEVRKLFKLKKIG